MIDQLETLASKLLTSPPSEKLRVPAEMTQCIVSIGLVGPLDVMRSSRQNGCSDSYSTCWHWKWKVVGVETLIASHGGLCVGKVLPDITVHKPL